VRDEIYWVVTASVHLGSSTSSRTSSPGSWRRRTRSQARSLTTTASTMHETVIQVFESYRDSEAVVDDVAKTFPEFAEKFTECVTIEGFACTARRPRQRAKSWTASGPRT